jgi:hypothetical protein
MLDFQLPWGGKMPDDLYHGKDMQKYVSSTMLKTLAHSPAHLRHMLDNPMIETDALRQGKALHCAILDGPDEFSRQYRVKSLDGRTAAGKAEKASMERDGVTCLTSDEHSMIMGIYHEFEQHPALMDTLSSDKDVPKFEHAILWEDKETGLLCRAKPDIYGANFMIDLKSTRDARPQRFNRQFFDLGYHIQAAHYAAGWESITGQTAEIGLDFYFFAAEKSPPFGNTMYGVPRDVMLYGKQERRDLMLKYADCVNKNEWPGYGFEVLELTLPWGVSSVDVGDGNDDDC